MSLTSKNATYTLKLYRLNPENQAKAECTPSDLQAQAQNGWESARGRNSHIVEYDQTTGRFYMYCVYNDWNGPRYQNWTNYSARTSTLTKYLKYATYGDTFMHLWYSTGGIDWVEQGIGQFWKAGVSGTEEPATYYDLYPLPYYIHPKKSLQATTYEAPYHS